MAGDPGGGLEGAPERPIRGAGGRRDRLRRVSERFRRAALTLFLSGFCAAFLSVAVTGAADHAASAPKGREVVVTHVSCLDGYRGSFCQMAWAGDDGVTLRAPLSGAESLDDGDRVTIAPKDLAAAPEDWAERVWSDTPGGVGRVMLLGPRALAGDVFLPLLLAAGSAMASAAVWGRWADQTTPGPGAAEGQAS